MTRVAVGNGLAPVIRELSWNSVRCLTRSGRMRVSFGQGAPGDRRCSSGHCRLFPQIILSPCHCLHWEPDVGLVCPSIQHPHHPRHFCLSHLPTPHTRARIRKQPGLLSCQERKSDPWLRIISLCTAVRTCSWQEGVLRAGPLPDPHFSHSRTEQWLFYLSEGQSPCRKGGH